MIVAQITDTHILPKNTTDPMGAARAGSLRRCIADINRRGVDAVIHTGDSVQHGSPEEYAHLHEIVSALNAPLFMTVGNRDQRSAMRDVFADRGFVLGEGEFVQYAVDDFAVRLVALDSTSPGERKGVFCSARLARLDETLAGEPHRPTILFIHHPPFDIPPHYEDGYRRPQDASEIATVVRGHPQVIRLICGHVHCIHRTDWAGTVSTTMPSIAVDLRKGVDPVLGTTPLYALHEISRNGNIATQMCAVSE
jgi:3',5'-cyclic-AMP phosphodiesterase